MTQRAQRPRHRVKARLGACWGLALALGASACVQEPDVAQDDPSGEGWEAGPESIDRGLPQDAGEAQDAWPQTQDASPRDDAAPQDGAPPREDAEPPPEGPCGAEASNACGGCGPLDEAGCVRWRIDLSQDEQLQLRPDLIALPLGLILRYEERAVEGGLCTLLEVDQVSRLWDLGALTLRSPQRTLHLAPEDRFNTVRYLPQDLSPSEPLSLYTPTEAIEMIAAGGARLGALSLQLSSPPALSGVTSADLQPIIDLIRGERSADYTLRWRAEGDAPLSFFVGASWPITFEGNFRATQALTLESGQLADRGELTLGTDLLGPAIPDSAVRVELGRLRQIEHPQGVHGVLTEVGQRISLAQSGSLEGGGALPFEIGTPPHARRQIRPGEAFEVSWGPLPPGTGPLVVSLSLMAQGQNVQRSLSCEVHAPGAGRFTLPADLIGAVPAAPEDLRMLSVRWSVHNAPLPAPHRGRVHRMILVQDLLEIAP